MLRPRNARALRVFVALLILSGIWKNIHVQGQQYLEGPLVQQDLFGYSREFLRGEGTCQDHTTSLVALMRSSPGDSCLLARVLIPYNAPETKGCLTYDSEVEGRWRGGRGTFLVLEVTREKIRGKETEYSLGI